MVKITPDLKEKMIQMRKAGSTYRQICESLGVTKGRCIAYLQHIETETSAATKDWMDAEKQAPEVLKQLGFISIT